MSNLSLLFAGAYVFQVSVGPALHQVQCHRDTCCDIEAMARTLSLYFTSEQESNLLVDSAGVTTTDLDCWVCIQLKQSQVKPAHTGESGIGQIDDIRPIFDRCRAFESVAPWKSRAPPVA